MQSRTHPARPDRTGFEEATRNDPSRRTDAAQFADEAGRLNTAGRFDEAARLCLFALSIDPRAFCAWSNLGNALAELQRHDDAIAAYANCLRIAPDHAPALANMGVVLQARGAPALAITFLEMAKSLEPLNPETRCNLGIALLAAGDFARGFAEYEWRWQTAAMTPHTDFAGRRWHGEHRPDATLLIHEEGGFGDVIQFVRFAAAARSRVGRVVLQVRAPLLDLLSRVEGVDAVVACSEPVPPHDLHCPILSLAHETGVNSTNLAGTGPYLRTNPDLDRLWQARVQADGPARLRVGLVWAGSPRTGLVSAARADLRRSIAAEAFGPILAGALAGTRFYSLQLGDQPLAQPFPSGRYRHFVDHTAHVRSFDDTASLIACLDLVIAVDTSTAHCAASLGKPVWMLSRFDQCWRWLSDRTDSPWYPSLRIFRQPAPADWAEPIARVAHELRTFVPERLA